MVKRAICVAVLVACGGKDNAGHVDAPNTTAEVDCSDGLDDNGDGKPDCADPTCANVVACVPAIPAGWTGYTVFYEGTAASAPSCSAPYATAQPLAHDGLDAPDATCSPCICSGSGICTASGGDPTLPPATWANDAVTCTGTTAATGCAGTDACEPNVPAPFAGPCIRSDGDVQCPSGSFSDRHVVYTSVTDTRACTACTCSPTICAIGGGAPTGSATATGAITFCCKA